MIEFVQAMPVVRTFDSSSETFSRYQKALSRLAGSGHRLVSAGQFFCPFFFCCPESAADIGGAVVGQLSVPVCPQP
ncbi:hypothetical protein P4S72_18795 [Vibrio sp. PP-XX7]